MHIARMDYERPVQAFLVCISGLSIFLGSWAIILRGLFFFLAILLFFLFLAVFIPGYYVVTQIHPDLLGVFTFGLIGTIAFALIGFPIYFAFWILTGLYREPRLHREIGILSSKISGLFLAVFVPVILPSLILYVGGTGSDTTFSDPLIGFH